MESGTKEKTDGNVINVYKKKEKRKKLTQNVEEGSSVTINQLW